MATSPRSSAASQRRLSCRAPEVGRSELDVAIAAGPQAARTDPPRQVLRRAANHLKAAAKVDGGRPEGIGGQVVGVQ
eukprot:7533246-Alexandrium_andersonii.AAC.1